MGRAACDGRGARRREARSTGLSRSLLRDRGRCDYRRRLHDRRACGRRERGAHRLRLDPASPCLRRFRMRGRQELRDSSAYDDRQRRIRLQRRSGRQAAQDHASRQRQDRRRRRDRRQLCDRPGDARFDLHSRRHQARQPLPHRAQLRSRRKWFLHGRIHDGRFDQDRQAVHDRRQLGGHGAYHRGRQRHLAGSLLGHQRHPRTRRLRRLSAATAQGGDEDRGQPRESQRDPQESSARHETGPFPLPCPCSCWSQQCSCFSPAPRSPRP